ncbi:MAG: recombinase family protein, partial [Thalassobaculaceae bacterium]
CREGDTLVVTKLSRFARSITDLWNNVDRLKTKGVHFKIF